MTYSEEAAIREAQIIFDQTLDDITLVPVQMHEVIYDELIEHLADFGNKVMTILSITSPEGVPPLEKRIAGMGRVLEIIDLHMQRTDHDPRLRQKIVDKLTKLREELKDA